MEEQNIRVNWYNIATFDTIGENLNNGWWYIKLKNEWHHIEAKYVLVR